MLGAPAFHSQGPRWQQVALFPEEIRDTLPSGLASLGENLNRSLGL